MRYRIFILLGLFLLGFVSATETNVVFTIGGCSYGESGIVKDSCSDDGKYFCDSDGLLISTIFVGQGCSNGREAYVLGSGTSCCPDGYKCVGEDGQFQCLERTEQCEIFTSKVDCIKDDCIWMEGLATCVSTLADYGCSYYTDQASCEEDNYSLGDFGIGTDVFGLLECKNEAFSVSRENSTCMWNDTYQDGQKCYLNYVAEQTFGSGASFSCSNVYELGDCIDGEQSVTWTSSNTSNNFDVPLDCLKALKCAGGKESRFCGEPSVRLPGFSVFSFFTSLVILGIFYFFVKK